MKSFLIEADEIKIFILYLLDKIGYPIDYPTIGQIVVRDGIVGFFDFAECFFALIEAGHIREIYPDGNTPEKAEIVDDPDVIPFDGVEEEFEKAVMEESSDVIPPKVLYEITESGKKAARSFETNIMEEVREKGYRSALRHLSLEKRDAKFEKKCVEDGDGYLVTCSITDKYGKEMELTVRADSKNQCDSMLLNFEERPEVVFRGIVALMSGDVNYLFEQ